MLYLIGIGLGQPEDITVKGLNIIKSADLVYLEAYTSIMSCGKDALEKFYGKEVILADREKIEQKSDEFLTAAKELNVVILVVGDPFGATTHSDLILRAVQMNVSYQVVHNASIMNAIGCCGLQLYNFGETVSIVFWEENWKPESFIDKIESNLERGLHTLCLLDIKVKEQTIENLMKGNKIYEKPRYMSVKQAASQLMEAITSGRDGILTSQTLSVGLAKVGSENQNIVAAPLSIMQDCDLGEPLHSLIICGNLHPLEKDFIKMFMK